MSTNLLNIKQIIQSNPIAVATIGADNKPNVIAVAFAKVVSKNELVITDNYMNQTRKDILKNGNICLAVWNSKWQGYKLAGKAKYFTSGKWKIFIETLKENKGLPAKGAILVKVNKVIKLS